MFKKFVEVIVSINKYGINNTIIIDNKKKCISFNGKYNDSMINEFNFFVESFFRIIREWKTEGNKKNENLY